MLWELPESNALSVTGRVCAEWGVSGLGKRGEIHQGARWTNRTECEEILCVGTGEDTLA